MKAHTTQRPYSPPVVTAVEPLIRPIHRKKPKAKSKKKKAQSPKLCLLTPTPSPVSIPETGLVRRSSRAASGVSSYLCLDQLRNRTIFAGWGNGVYKSKYQTALARSGHCVRVAGLT